MTNQNIFDTILSSVKLKIDMKKMLGEIITEDQLDGIIDSVLVGFSIVLEDSERQKMRNAIEYYTQIKHTEDQIILDEYDDVRDWYSKIENKNGWFWTRYKDYLRRTGDLDPVSINKLENDTLIKLMNCLGDPRAKVAGKSLRKGLVIGDVQSGKTATYIGMICKAADAGYKVVILLTGITETLRQQTQERVEEGILGYTIRSYGRGKNRFKSSSRVGVGLDNMELRASAFTSFEDDFKGDVDQVTMSLKSHDSLVLFVVKKNVAVLNKLHKWLTDYNKDMLDDLIHAPMLLIDDEADNASINTSKDKLDPTETNKVIRKICSSFNNATYVGFTATPFANVFIDPETTEEMKNADLFPSNFIYVLPTPSSYIGAKEIFYPYGRCYSSIKFIEDIVEPTREEIKSDPEKDSRPLYYKHSKEWHGLFPDSLKDSIRCFYLANVIRDLRGDMGQPRTMMINVSRFVKVHRYIQEWVQSLYSRDINEILTNFSDSQNDNIGNPLFSQLSELFDKHFSNCGIQKTKVLDKAQLLKSIEPVQVIVVNSKKDSGKLDYKSNPSLRAIAIGGLSLSRGLTLKGLITSYFYRNTSTFDVLMQMGRWFGYRQGYDDIFQIWTSHESAEWYMDISIATEELKQDIHKMFDDKLTPKEFGIKVRDISDELQITSANKMRNAFNHYETIVFWGGLFETPYANLVVKNNTNNLNCTRQFLQKLVDDSIDFSQNGLFGTVKIEKVPYNYISSLLSSIKISLKNMRFDIEHLQEFISDECAGVLKEWDVCVYAGNSKDEYRLTDKFSIYPMVRTLHLKGNHIAFTNKAVLGSPSDGMLSLSTRQIEKAKQDYLDAEGKVPGTYPGATWFKYVQNRRPCLMIYFVRPADVDPSKIDRNNPTELETIKDRLIEYKNELGDAPMVAYAVGFPKCDSKSYSTKTYKVNKVYYKQILEEAGEEDDDL